MKLQKKDANGSKTYNVEECLEKISGINGTASEINQKLGKIEEKYTAAEKAKVNAIPENPKYTDTVYDDTTIKHDVSVLSNQLTADRGRITTIESKLSGNGSVTIANLTTKGEVEIYGAQPHIDFHYGNSTEDKTSRIIETTSGKLDLQAANGVLINGKKTANENVTLTAKTDRIQNVKCMAKYFPLLGIVFARIQGNIIYSMTAGKGYTLFNIDNSYWPDSNAALSVKVGTDDSKAFTKKAAAYAKTTGGINIQPLDGDLKGYDVYITGFWFV